VVHCFAALANANEPEIFTLWFACQMRRRIQYQYDAEVNQSGGGIMSYMFTKEHLRLLQWFPW